MLRRLFLTLCVAVVVLGFFLVLGSAQDPPPPPKPIGQAGDAAVADGDDAEVYNRGPIHEGFAVPGSTDPVKGEIVTKPVPEDIDEIPPDEQPDGDNIVWLPGYWAFDEELDDFLWVSGVWREVPPGRTWIPGYWAPMQGGSQWTPGNWADANAEEISYVPEPPSTQERGPSSPSPGEEYFWVPGNWVYANSYQWRPGYWTPHQESWIWIPARYTWTPYGFIYTPGYWDYLPPYRGMCFAPIRFRRPGRVRYMPIVVLDSWQSISVSLFVGPRYGCYYFGNYYGPRYVTGGYVPFFEYHRHRRCHDPYYVYERWRYGRNYDVRIAGWHRYFRDHEDFRPRNTFRAQQEFAQKHRGNEAVALTMVSADLNEVVRSKKLPFNYRKVSKEQKDRYENQARKFRDFTKEQIADDKKAPNDDKKTPTDGKDGKKGNQGARKGIRLRGNEMLAMPVVEGDVNAPGKSPDKKGDGQPGDDKGGQKKRNRRNVPGDPDKLKSLKPGDGAKKGLPKGNPNKSDPDQFLPDLPAVPPDQQGDDKKGTDKNGPDKKGPDMKGPGKKFDKGPKGKQGTFIPRGNKKMDKSPDKVDQPDKVETQPKKTFPKGKNNKVGGDNPGGTNPGDTTKQKGFGKPKKIEVPKADKKAVQKKFGAKKKTQPPPPDDTDQGGKKGGN